VNEDVVRVLAPQVLGILGRRGNDFAAAEDAVQDALLEAHRTWGDAPPDDLQGRLLTVAGRKRTDSRRSEEVRRVAPDRPRLSVPARAAAGAAGRRGALRHAVRAVRGGGAVGTGGGGRRSTPRRA
jgi:predicted RNA polymerase sigma factor